MQDPCCSTNYADLAFSSFQILYKKYMQLFGYMQCSADDLNKMQDQHKTRILWPRSMVVTCTILLYT